MCGPGNCKLQDYSFGLRERAEPVHKRRLRIFTNIDELRPRNIESMFRQIIQVMLIGGPEYDPGIIEDLEAWLNVFGLVSELVSTKLAGSLG